MARFRVIVTGTGMEIAPDGAVGFATTRFIRAPSPDEAARLAVAQVSDSVASGPAFLSSPAPVHGIGLIARVWSPLKRSQPNSGYSFAGSDADFEDILDIERRAGAGWFL